MKHFLFPLLGFLFIGFHANGQDSLETTVAKSGDGIFSLLRKHGINPASYYAEFLALNQENIKNGSELYIGREYLLPDAPDSFKNMGRLIKVPENTESSIFEKELAKLNSKSNTLKNAVYYLISENDGENNMFIEDITMNLAKELLVNGARVYIIKQSQDGSEEDHTSSDMEAQTETDHKESQLLANAQNYVDVINKRYLRHSKKYQRILVVRSNGSTSSRNLDVSIFHHDKSEEGQKFAENIQSVFRDNGIKSRSVENLADVFEDKNNLFLATNTLVPITIVEMGDFKSNQNQKKISVRSDKQALAKWLTNGLFKDYADLEIEE